MQTITKTLPDKQNILLILEEIIRIVDDSNHCNSDYVSIRFQALKAHGQLKGLPYSLSRLNEEAENHMRRKGILSEKNSKDAGK